MSLKAIGKKIIILQKNAETTTSSGLVIPDSAQERPQEGTVIDISTEASTETDIHAGMTVVYSKYGSTIVTNDGHDYVICEIKDILAVIE